MAVKIRGPGTNGTTFTRLETVSFYIVTDVETCVPNSGTIIIQSTTNSFKELNIIKFQKIFVNTFLHYNLFNFFLFLVFTTKQI